MIRIFFDLDGTLSQRITLDELKVMKNDGFFIDREPTKLLHLLREALNGMYGVLKDNIYLCSAYMPDSNSLEEKSVWSGRWLPEIDNAHRIFLPCGVNKASAVQEMFGEETLSTDYYLVDDFSKNLHEWKESGGSGIKYLNGENGNNGTWKGAKATSFDDIMEAVLTGSGVNAVFPNL